MTSYYNEIDPYAAQWLRNLIAAGHIAPGDVDERDIRDVRPDDLKSYTQCHFFAGIGVWSYALRLAGWPDDTPVWTGSCPCQPFSSAGKRKGTSDERHLWPVWFELIRECRPAIIFGEQVASGAAVGKYVSAEVQELWDRQAALRLLENRVQRNLSVDLQDLPKCGGSGVAGDSAERNSVQGEQACICSKGAGIGQGRTLRPDAGMGPSSIEPGLLRSDRHRVRYDRATGVEQPVIGPPGSGGGIRAREHKTGAVCAECGLRKLGGESTPSDNRRNLEAAAREIGRAIASNSTEIESANGYSWINALQADLEGLDYAGGPVPFPSAGVGAPHIRDRTFWVAESAVEGRRAQPQRVVGPDGRSTPEPGRLRSVERLGDSGATRLEGRDAGALGDERAAAERTGEAGGLADPDGRHPGAEGLQRGGQHGLVAQDDGASGLADSDVAGSAANTRNASQVGGFQEAQREPEHGTAIPGGSGADGRPGPVNGFWRDADWLFCTDGKWRPVEPGTFPLVNGAANRVGRLRAYGNAINAEAAAQFIAAYQDTRKELT